MRRSPAILALFGALGFAGPALSHSWYDPWCCNHRDCKPYPTENVTVTSTGYLLHDGTLVPFEDARTSQDAGYHRCVLNGQQRCFYAPPVGM